jgi:Rrf2 family transcriptional regulator, repressor of oqxAB
MIDVRFATALQIMLSLALAHAEGVARISSRKLAEGVDSNPTFVRKLLAPLIRAGLVVSASGKEGGVSLACQPDNIPLGTIYRTASGSGPFWPIRRGIPHRCLVSCNFNDFFLDLGTAAERAVLSELAGRTLGDALRELRARSASHRGVSSP